MGQAVPTVRSSNHLCSYPWIWGQNQSLQTRPSMRKACLMSYRLVHVAPPLPLVEVTALSSRDTRAAAEVIHRVTMRYKLLPKLLFPDISLLRTLANLRH